MTTIQSFKSIRRAGVPLCAIETADPAATVGTCCRAMNGKQDTCILVAWDIIQGLHGLNDAGKAFAQDVSPDGPIQSGNPAECLKILADKAPSRKEDGSGALICFWHNAQRFIDNESVAQGVWNLRDVFKGKGALLVLLAPSLVLPPELKQDVVIVSESLPDEAELGAVVDDIATAAGLPADKIGDKGVIVDTLRGLSAFAAEQVLAMSISPEAIDTAGLWDRKVKAIEQTKGLTVYRGKERFADVGGLGNAKEIMAKTIRGKTRVSCIVFADELDKAVSAAGTDTSGTTQDQVKVLLSYMQDNDVLGMLMLGPPGTGKTMLAKAAANEHGVPLIMLDLGAMKGSLVGASEQSMRTAIQVIHSISDGRALFVGACNRSDNIPPELRRRFNYCSLFVDLPDPAERAALWSLWQRKYSLPVAPHGVSDDGYTGAEIRNCCLKSWAMECSLAEASQSIVPVAKSAADQIEALRRGASGRFVSASRKGLFYHRQQPDAAPAGRIGD